MVKEEDDDDEASQDTDDDDVVVVAREDLGNAINPAVVVAVVMKRYLR